jgi:hypothetical protein
MITLIWHSNKETGWEVDWIEYLFKDIPHTSIADYDQKLEIDNSFIIYNRTAPVDEYAKRLHARGLNFGLIHVSDEWLEDSTETYQYAKVVLRNYYKDLGPNVINFPLGWMRTFPYDLTPKTVFQRAYTWSFSGHVDKTTRPAMAAAMSTVPNGLSYFKKCGEHWGPFEGHALDPIQLAELYNNSIFVPCPQGNCSIDSLRVCEALQAGSIPIVEKSNYWDNLYGVGNPLLQVKDWKDAPETISVLMEKYETLEQLRGSTYRWWINHCDKLKHKILNLL